MKKLTSLTIALAALFASFSFAPAAFAHDEVVDTYPTSGETVEAGQINIGVNFNEEVLASSSLEGFAIEVSDAKGNAQPAGCLMAGGTNVSVIASLAEAGDYTVNWRSVSSDGHPNEGTFKFTVANTTGYEQEAADQLACPMLMAGEPMPTMIDDSMKRDATAVDDEGNALVGLAIGAGFIVLGGVATAITVKVREKRASKKPAATASED
jgi:methionine-rich copper-binding protein CopC